MAASSSSSSSTRRPLTIVYLDGCNNQYTFTTSSSSPSQYNLEYDPMTPIMSSSGTYSGGSAWTLNLTESQSSSLLKWIDTLIGSTNDHASGRMMGTASVQVQYPLQEGDKDEGGEDLTLPYTTKSKTRIILKRGSEQRAAFESFISDLRKSTT